MKHANRSRLNSMIQPLTLADMYLKINDDGLSYIEDIHEVQSALMGLIKTFSSFLRKPIYWPWQMLVYRDRQPDPALFAFLSRPAIDDQLDYEI